MAESFLTGLIGSGIGASKSPSLHEREGERNGLRVVYRLIDIDDLGLDATRTPELLNEALRMGYAGLNITHPCKQVVFQGLEEVSPEAATIGAVNTVVFDGTRAIGHNTDWIGVGRALDHDLPDVAVGEVVLVGAGGAGSAVAYALLRRGVRRLTIVDADRTRAAVLAARMNRRFAGPRAVASDDLESALRHADGVINATPVGMPLHPGLPFPPELLAPHQWVLDLIYVPAETELLRTARAIGCRTMSGGAMLVFQAAEAFRLFTGTRPDAGRMLRHYQSLSTCQPDPVAA
ncbi:shikimate dehydrogenase [Spongiactinospora sp. TRM90649]|uniref:shikimate dehydrogenase n=1 Tax=Spongiactinospora sp. TRM90649 TaxID=3031114 RepID=UPI0023F832AB|nr:shikimate dehydrogenase [Spongiactinospora sp. TRM90649]MDF5753566.1 shikimate dehydrogenase [Spongiactinospora sp. TRM90649]